MTGTCLSPPRYARPVAVAIRHVQPSDYGRVIQHVNAWWGGREMAPLLPRLFFIHFEGTSFVADREDGSLAGFLIGFLSQTDAETAFVHFIGVAPSERGTGLGRELYERFFLAAREHGRSVVRCVTSPENADSLAFHEALGFEVEGVSEDYDAGEGRVQLARRLV
jgi:predicted GNAT superfamily acetyltransferase